MQKSTHINTRFAACLDQDFIQGLLGCVLVKFDGLLDELPIVYESEHEMGSMRRLQSMNMAGMDTVPRQMYIRQRLNEMQMDEEELVDTIRCIVLEQYIYFCMQQ